MQQWTRAWRRTRRSSGANGDQVVTLYIVAYSAGLVLLMHGKAPYCRLSACVLQRSPCCRFTLFVRAPLMRCVNKPMPPQVRRGAVPRAGGRSRCAAVCGGRALPGAAPHRGRVQRGAGAGDAGGGDGAGAAGGGRGRAGHRRAVRLHAGGGTRLQRCSAPPPAVLHARCELLLLRVQQRCPLRGGMWYAAYRCRHAWPALGHR